MCHVTRYVTEFTAIRIMRYMSTLTPGDVKGFAAGGWPGPLRLCDSPARPYFNIGITRSNGNASTSPTVVARNSEL
jgi:hypothetical protein